MKSQDGMGHLTLIISIVAIIVLVLGIGYIALQKIEKAKLETYETNMLLIQGKIKVIASEATVQKKDELLKGVKLEDFIEEEQIKKILESGIISKEEISFSGYYILKQEQLSEMGLNSIKLKDGYFIVNYDTGEVIYSNGIKIGKNTYYKLSELKNIESKEELQNQLNEI